MWKKITHEGAPDEEHIREHKLDLMGNLQIHPYAVTDANRLQGEALMQHIMDLQEIPSEQFPSLEELRKTINSLQSKPPKDLS